MGPPGSNAGGLHRHLLPAVSRLPLARPSLGFFPGGIFIFIFIFKVEMNHVFIFIFKKLEMNHKIIFPSAVNYSQSGPQF